MSIIQTPGKFPLPNTIAQILKTKNYSCHLTINEKGNWILEGSTIFVYKSWVADIFPNPWNEALYTILKNISYGVYKKEYKDFFLVSDNPPVEATIALPFDSAIVIEELSTRFKISPSEALLGLITQLTNSLIRNPLNTEKQENK